MLSKVDSKGTTSYTYDEVNRLLTVTEPGGKVTTYTYDNNGNQLVTTSIAYVDGAAQAPEVTTNTYDDLNQLIESVNPDGTSIINTYNGEGIRVQKQSGSTVTKYLYEGNKVILELDGAGNQKARNIYGINQISRIIDGQTAYYFFNGHGDTTKLIGTSGEVLNSYYYDAFGNNTEVSETIDNPYRYAGYQYDKETKTYYIMARMYDPETGRFLQEDTYRGDIKDPLSLNLYTYCHNNPITYDDPTGHFLDGVVSLLGKAASGIKDAAAGAWDAISDAASSIGNAISDAASSAYKSVSNAASNAWNGLKSAFSSLGKSVSSALRSISSKTSSIGRSISNRVTNTVSKVKKTFSNVQNRVKSSLTNANRIASKAYEYKEQILDGVQLALDVAGFIPVFGDALDGVNGVISLARGNYADAAFSFAAMIPGAGSTATAAKWVKKGEKAYETAKIAEKNADEVIEIASEGKKAISEGVEVLEGGACFTAGTLILTKNGYKSIEDIKVGDEVYSENTETGEKGYKKVAQTFQRVVNTTVHLSIGSEKIDTTENHPFYVKDKGFVKAGELKQGDKVVTASGDTLTVDKVEIEKTEEATKVYNFEVEDWHTYFVSSEEVLVHNSCSMPIPEGAADPKKIDYKKVFFDEYPDLEGNVVVHHGVEQQVLKKPQTQGLFTPEEMHSLDNLRGIPKEINSDLHLSKIRKEWNRFYKEFPNPTKEQLLNKRLEIDNSYGDLFNPPIK